MKKLNLKIGKLKKEKTHKQKNYKYIKPNLIYKQYIIILRQIFNQIKILGGDLLGLDFKTSLKNHVFNFS